MGTTDESENLLDHLSERTNANGWRVIGNPARKPEPQSNKLKTRIQTMPKRQRTSVKHKLEETEPPEGS